MFLVIPFMHLTNDEDTKAILADEGWYQGLRNLLGIYNEVEPEAPQGILQAQQNPNQRVQRPPDRNAEPSLPQRLNSPQAHSQGQGLTLSKQRTPPHKSAPPQGHIPSVSLIPIRGSISQQGPIFSAGLSSPDVQILPQNRISSQGPTSPQRPISTQERISPQAPIANQVPTTPQKFFHPFGVPS